jgi:rubrerythrin
VRAPEQPASEQHFDEPTGDDDALYEEPEESNLDGVDEEDALADEEIIEDADMALLVAMAELDAEAAEAYRIAAENTVQVHLRAKLEEFRLDHLRHVETFNRLFAEAGEPGVSTELDDQSSALTMLAASMSLMGARQALLGMLANEQLTNMNYRAVAELPFEAAIAEIIEQHLADEERHLAWLRDQEPHVGDDSPAHPTMGSS